MREESHAQSEAIVLRNILAALALETKLIRLRRQLHAKGWETQPRAPAGQPNGGDWFRARATANGPCFKEISPRGSRLRIRPRSRRAQR